MVDQKRIKLKVGIIGCGNIARVHLKYIKKYIEKENIVLCDKDELRLDDFSKKVGIENKYKDLKDMVQEFHPDIIHVLTPPTTHKDIAVKCLEDGCHVLIEKPMCISTEEADEIIKIAREKNLMVCVNHMRLYDPLIIKVKEILNSGKIGEIVNISACYSHDFLKRTNTDAASRWMNDLPGGVFFDVLPHPLCLLEEFLPDLKVEKSVYWKNKDDMITDLWCIFSSSSGTGSLHMSLNIFPLRNYVVFECKKGMLKVDFRNFLLTIRRQHSLPNAFERIVGNFSVGMQILKGTTSSIFNFIRGKLDSYSGLDYIIKEFYTSIIINGKSLVPPEKARLLLALTEKIFNKRLVVQEKFRDAQKKQFKKFDFLVTGGTGFIGRRIVNRLLEKGYRVRVLSRRNLSNEELNTLFCTNANVEIVHGDIYNYEDVEEACKGTDIVYHLAAATQGDLNYHFDTTITGTKNILEAATKMGVNHLVYISTLNVYNAKQYRQGSLINEDFPYEDMPEKRGAYSHAKLKAEKIVKEYMNKTKMSISILRPGLVYGPGGKVFHKDIGYRLNKKVVVVLGIGTRRLPLIYVDNLVDALLLAAEKREKAKGIFNVVDEDYPTQRKFIETYKKLTGEKFITLYIPFKFLLFVLRTIEFFAFTIFKKSFSFTYKLKCVSKSVIHSTEYIKNRLGWKQKINFEEGLKLALQK